MDDHVKIRWVYSFGDGKAEGRAEMKNLLGGKGANLAEMSNLGLPVPPGFTITTEVCTYYYKNGQTYPSDLKDQVTEALAAVERSIGAGFGDPENPLLVSVRSGARASMPGMMDTVLNLGLTDITVQGLVRRSGDARFAYDSYRRFIQMYGNVVLGVEHHHFEDILENVKRDRDITLDTELVAADWQAVIEGYKQVVEHELGRPFPQDVHEQLWGAVGAVFSSWMNQRAITYRRLHDIPAEWGTAVNVQAMVFGNMGDDCATGVAFTRDPSTGENAFYGEYLVNAQGEDVVAGIRTPQHLTIAGKQANKSTSPPWKRSCRRCIGQLDDVRLRLESTTATCRTSSSRSSRTSSTCCKPAPASAPPPPLVKIAVDMANEALIDRDRGDPAVDPASLDQLLHPPLDPKAERTVIAQRPARLARRGIGQAGVQRRRGRAAQAQPGEAVILSAIETSPEDIHGMHAAQGILTSTRRHDQPRGRRRPRHGQGLRRRRR